MSDQLNSGKGFLKEKLGAYQVDPPESAWNSISATLGGRNRKRGFVILFATAASIALALTVGISYFGAGSSEQLSEVEQALPELQSGIDTATHISHAKRGEKLQDKVIETMAMMAVEAQPEKEDTGEVSLAYQEPESDQKPEFDQKFESLSTFDVPSSDSSELTLHQKADTALILTLDAGEDLPLDPFPEFDAAKKRDPRWMLGAVMSPLYSYRDADMEAMSGGAEYESGLVSFAGGINVSYRGNSRLAIESGIHFNKMGISIGAPGIKLFGNSFDFAPPRDISSSPELIAITNSVGNIVTESGQVIVNGYKLNAQYGADALLDSEVANAGQVAEQGIEQHLDYLEVPFNLRYTLVDRTFELQLVGGLSTNFLVNNYVTMETGSGTADIGYLTNIRSVNYSGNAGIGMIYHIHERFSLLLEPRFRYFLNSVNDASLPTTRPYALGLYTGISYTF
jgi:hypothetical protein